MKLKICFVLLRAYAVFRPEMNKEFGGAEVQCYLLTKELAEKKDLQVTCIAKDYRQNDIDEIEKVIHYKIKQPKGGIVKFKFLKNFFSAFSLYQTLKKIDADIYVQICFGAETGITALFCKRHNKKFIFMAASDNDTDGSLEKSSSCIIAFLYRYGIKNTSKVITQNFYQQKTLSERFSRQSQIITSLCHVPDAYVPPVGERILWVARLVELKQPEKFLEMAQSFPDLKFLMIAGQGTDEKYFWQICKDGEKISNLEMVPKVSPHEVEKYFAHSKLLINTSVYEGFPDTFVKAFKFSMPVLSLNVDPDNILSNENIGFCAKGDMEELKGHLRFVVSDSELYLKMSKNAYEYVKKNHDVGVIISKYEEIFTSLFEDNERSASSVKKDLLKPQSSPSRN